MKKIVFCIVAVAVIVVASLGVVNSGLRGTPLSNLTLANIQALAQGEDDIDCSTGTYTNLNCPYWDVSWEFPMGGTPIKRCHTGGEYKC